MEKLCIKFRNSAVVIFLKKFTTGSEHTSIYQGQPLFCHTLSFLVSMRVNAACEQQAPCFAHTAMAAFAHFEVLIIYDR